MQMNRRWIHRDDAETWDRPWRVWVSQKEHYFGDDEVHSEMDRKCHIRVPELGIVGVIFDNDVATRLSEWASRRFGRPKWEVRCCYYWQR